MNCIKQVIIPVHTQTRRTNPVLMHSIFCPVNTSSNNLYDKFDFKFPPHCMRKAKKHHGK